MVTHAYPRARYLTGVIGQDVILIGALIVLAFLPPPEPLASALRIALPLVLLWGFVTLHVPSRIDVSDEAIVFHRYGRAHRFAWRDVERVRVRRFLVRDRVMVRIAPSSAWRGRYWIFDTIDGFDSLVRDLEKRDRARAPAER
jgi:hypothetical protein